MTAENNFLTSIGGLIEVQQHLIVKLFNMAQQKRLSLADEWTPFKTCQWKIPIDRSKAVSAFVTEQKKKSYHHKKLYTYSFVANFYRYWWQKTFLNSERKCNTVGWARIS